MESFINTPSTARFRSKGVEKLRLRELVDLNRKWAEKTVSTPYPIYASFPEKSPFLRTFFDSIA